MTPKLDAVRLYKCDGCGKKMEKISHENDGIFVGLALCIVCVLLLAAVSMGRRISFHDMYNGCYYDRWSGHRFCDASVPDYLIHPQPRDEVSRALSCKLHGICF